MNTRIYFKRKVAGDSESSLILNIPKEIVQTLDINKGDYLDCSLEEIEGLPAIVYRKRVSDTDKEESNEEEILPEELSNNGRDE